MADSSESSFKLQDRTAILTGPCTTYNQAIAQKLTQLGANVALIDRNIERAQRFATQMMDQREINERYGRAVAIAADLAKQHHVQDAITRTAESFGGIDIFIDGLMTTEVVSFKTPNALDELDRLIDINLRAPILFTHGVMRFLESRKRGRIIYLLHDLARVGFEKNSLLAATRTGLTQFAKTLARETASANITVNCVALGLTEEFVLAQHKDAGSIQAAQEKLKHEIPHALMTEPDRMANVVAFLASPLGAGVTGQTIAASQGLSLLG
ncbi:MAG: SDR family oxidoreductase [Bdellovibrionaceae bacterium]|nr:SDR family oxidoreductase [Pseudobdellovibrionaceae bacterium]